VDLKDELPTSVAGNLSGKPTWDLSNKLIRRSYLEYGEKLTIIGVGGIFSADDAYTKIRLGASLVELITGMIFEGPQLPSQIADGLL
jgi:dihydroorotate dehydrogenase